MPKVCSLCFTSLRYCCIAGAFLVSRLQVLFLRRPPNDFFHTTCTCFYPASSSQQQRLCAEMLYSLGAYTLTTAWRCYHTYYHCHEVSKSYDMQPVSYWQVYSSSLASRFHNPWHTPSTASAMWHRHLNGVPQFLPASTPTSRTTIG